MKTTKIKDVLIEQNRPIHPIYVTGTPVAVAGFKCTHENSSIKVSLENGYFRLDATHDDGAMNTLTNIEPDISGRALVPNADADTTLLILNKILNNFGFKVEIIKEAVDDTRTSS